MDGGYTVLHLCENLTLGGVGRVVENLSRAHDCPARPSRVVGLTGDQDYLRYVTSDLPAGSVCAAIASNLGDIIAPDVPFGVVIHRSGEKSDFWDGFVPALRAHGAQAVLDANVFGYADQGPVSQLTDLVVCNSLHTLWRHWTAMGRPDIDTYLRKHRVIYNPVVLNPGEAALAAARTQTRKALGIPDDAIVFFDVCRPAPEKLDWMVVEVLKALAREQANVYMIARSFPPAPAQALQAVMGERFINLPVSVREGDVFSTIAAGDVLLHLSSMGESFGMAVAEAMRCGRPVIANATPGAKQNNAQCELVRDGETGFVVSGPVATLAAMRKLAGNGALRRSMGAASRLPFLSGPLNPEVIAGEFNKEIAAARRGGTDPVSRQPDNQACRRYLLEYRPARYREPIPTSLWAIKVNIARCLWRRARKKSVPTRKPSGFSVEGTVCQASE